MMLASIKRIRGIAYDTIKSEVERPDNGKIKYHDNFYHRPIVFIEQELYDSIPKEDMDMYQATLGCEFRFIKFHEDQPEPHVDSRKQTKKFYMDLDKKHKAKRR